MTFEVGQKFDISSEWGHVKIAKITRFWVALAYENAIYGYFLVSESDLNARVKSGHYKLVIE